MASNLVTPLGRPYTRLQVRHVIKERLRADPGRSNRAIAAELGTSGPTVAAVRRKLEEKGDIPKVDTSTGRDGRRRLTRIFHQSS